MNVAEERLVSIRILNGYKQQTPPRFTSKWGAFHCTSFSFSLLNNLSAISFPSLIGSVTLPISLVANTRAESLMKSTSFMRNVMLKPTMIKAHIVPKGKTNANFYCSDDIAFLRASLNLSSSIILRLPHSFHPMYWVM